MIDPLKAFLQANALTAPAFAQESDVAHVPTKKDPIRFRAFAVNMQAGMSGVVDIVMLQDGVGTGSATQSVCPDIALEAVAEPQQRRGGLPHQLAGAVHVHDDVEDPALGVRAQVGRAGAAQEGASIRRGIPAFRCPRTAPSPGPLQPPLEARPGARARNRCSPCP